MRRVRTIAAIVAPVLALASGAARADTLGPIGRVIALEIVEQTSDLYASYHGRIVVDDAVGGGTISYKWGGNQCPGLDVADPAFLQRGFGNPRMLIAPAFKNGAGGAREFGSTQLSERLLSRTSMLLPSSMRIP